MRAATPADGVVRKRGPLRARVLAAAAVAAILLLAFLGSRALEAPATPPAMPAALPATPAEPPRDDAPAMRPRDPAERALLKAFQAKPRIDEDEPMADHQAAKTGGDLHISQLPRGDGTGIDAFPRPGEKRIQRGLIVPDGYVLPPGYVRHYQTTDDGEQLPPILKFHPDHVPPGAPRDGIVPPELAPRDMPQTWLEPPPPSHD